MTRPRNTEPANVRMRRTFFFLAAGLQIGGGAIFTDDVIIEQSAATPHTRAKTAGVVAHRHLGRGLPLREYRHLLRRNERVERALGSATGRFQQSMEVHFRDGD